MLEAYPVDAERLAGADDPALAQLAQLRRERERLGLAYADGLLTDDTYQARKADLDAREAALPAPARRTARDLSELAALVAAFPTLSPAVQNRCLQEWLVARVVVSGREVEIIPHPTIAQLLAEVALGREAA